MKCYLIYVSLLTNRNDKSFHMKGFLVERFRMKHKD